MKRPAAKRPAASQCVPDSRLVSVNLLHQLSPETAKIAFSFVPASTLFFIMARASKATQAMIIDTGIIRVAFFSTQQKLVRFASCMDRLPSEQRISSIVVTGLFKFSATRAPRNPVWDMKPCHDVCRVSWCQRFFLRYHGAFIRRFFPSLSVLDVRSFGSKWEPGLVLRQLKCVNLQILSIRYSASARLSNGFRENELVSWNGDDMPPTLKSLTLIHVDFRVPVGGQRFLESLAELRFLKVMIGRPGRPKTSILDFQAAV